MLLSLMSIEETVETKVRTDSLNFEVSYAYKFKKVIRSTGIILFVGF